MICRSISGGLMLSIAILAGCQNKSGMKMSHSQVSEAVILNDPLCRISINRTPPFFSRWNVRTGDPSRFLSEDGKYFFITKDLYPNPAPDPNSIEFEKMDEVRTSRNPDGTISLVHSRGSVEIGRGTLRLKDRYWASGDAYKNGSPIGLYVMFLLADSATCGHPGQNGSSCRSAHFEFFHKDDDYNNKVNLPVLLYNVTLESSCVTLAPRQTDDGDGDLGPDD